MCDPSRLESFRWLRALFIEPFVREGGGCVSSDFIKSLEITRGGMGTKEVCVIDVTLSLHARKEGYDPVDHGWGYDTEV